MTAGNSSPELVTVAGHLAYSLSMHAELTHDEEHAEARRLLDAISYEPTSPVGSVPLPLNKRALMATIVAASVPGPQRPKRVALFYDVPRYRPQADGRPWLGVRRELVGRGDGASARQPCRDPARCHPEAEGRRR
jgi:hypothetical protein